jgi:hypothetical protein
MLQKVAFAKSNAGMNRDHSTVSGVRRIDADICDGATKCRASLRGAAGPINYSRVAAT